MSDWTEQEKTLRSRRDELLSDLDEIQDVLDETVPKDWEDAAVERQGDEVLTALAEHDSAEIRRIDAALHRIESGEYGYCVKCGTEISSARLIAVPDTPFCNSCT